MLAKIIMSKTLKIPSKPVLADELLRFSLSSCSRLLSRGSTDRDRFLVTPGLLRACVESILGFVSSEGGVVARSALVCEIVCGDS